MSRILCLGRVNAAELTPQWRDYLTDHQTAAKGNRVAKFIHTYNVSSLSLGCIHINPTMWTSQNFKCQSYKWQRSQQKMKAIPPPQPPDKRENFVYNQKIAAVICGNLESCDTSSRDAALTLLTVTKFILKTKFFLHFSLTQF
jgi:hypothetical protein